MIPIFILPKIQAFAIASSVVLFFLLIYLIRNKRIKEEYSLLWLLFGVIFIIFSTWRSGLDFIANIVGISYPPAAMMLLFMLAYFFILIQFSTIISRLSDRNKNLTQEIGLLKMEMDKIKNQLKLSNTKTRDQKEKDAYQ